MVQPCDLRAARDFVTSMHRHSNAPIGHKFSLALLDEKSRKFTMLQRGIA